MEFPGGFYDAALKGSSLLCHRGIFLFIPQIVLTPKSSLPPVQCSSPIHPPPSWPQTPALLSSSQPSSSPEFYWQGYFSILGISPLSTSVTTEENQHLGITRQTDMAAPKPSPAFRGLAGAPSLRSRRWPKTLIKRMCNSSTLSMMETTCSSRWRSGHTRKQGYMCSRLQQTHGRGGLDRSNVGIGRWHMEKWSLARRGKKNKKKRKEARESPYVQLARYKAFVVYQK